MNIFLHELRAYRKSTFIWTLALVGLVILFLSVFPAFTKDAEQFKKLLESYPKEVLQAFGVQLDTITSLIGYYTYVFSYIMLCGSIQAMNLGISVLSKEAREKTADFLLTKPVTRKQIVTAKLAAVLTSLVITNMIFLPVTVITAMLVSTEAFDMEIFLLISLTAFLVELMFLVLGILVSVVVPKIKSVLPISLATVFGFYILNMFGAVIGEEAIQYLTPFNYYDTVYIMNYSRYETVFVLIEAAFILIALMASYVIYAKKDIHAV